MATVLGTQESGGFATDASWVGNKHEAKLIVFTKGTGD
jgi:hypothetical protein